METVKMQSTVHFSIDCNYIYIIAGCQDNE